MNVNWQNLVTKIQNGQLAYDGSGFGNPSDNSSLYFYDHPISNLGDASAEENRIRPNDFVIGTSKWGGSDLVTD